MTKKVDLIEPYLNINKFIINYIDAKLVVEKKY